MHAIEDERSGEKIKFLTSLEKSSDLNDNLQELTDFLQKHTGATKGVVAEVNLDVNAPGKFHSNFRAVLAKSKGHFRFNGRSCAKLFSDC